MKPIASVRLLHSQHWSFISSVTPKDEAKKWFAPITGLASVTSTIAAGSISHLLESLNLYGLLITAAAIMLVGAKCSDAAYRIAELYGFSPVKESDEKQMGDSEGAPSSAQDRWKENEMSPKKTKTTCSSTGGLFVKASALFKRVPILGALFVEVLLCQSLSSLLNFLFLVKTKEAIPGDEERAGWSGKVSSCIDIVAILFCGLIALIYPNLHLCSAISPIHKTKCYAWTNGVSGFLQFLVMPFVMRWADPRWIWLLMPATMIVLVLHQCLASNASLMLVGSSFFWMKTQEYSFRPVVSELIYVHMDFESRYLGKEVINLMADRMGKSGMAIALFLATTYYDEHVLLSTLSNVAFVAACIWLLSSLRLMRLISPARGRAHIDHSEATER